MGSAHPQGTHAEATAPQPMFLRMSAVVQMTGLGRTTIYRLMADDAFPSPVKLGPRAIAWRKVDVERWGATRPVS